MIILFEKKLLTYRQYTNIFQLRKNEQEIEKQPYLAMSPFLTNQVLFVLICYCSIF